jgi:hypothetical protein
MRRTCKHDSEARERCLEMVTDLLRRLEPIKHGSEELVDMEVVRVQATRCLRPSIEDLLEMFAMELNFMCASGRSTMLHGHVFRITLPIRCQLTWYHGLRAPVMWFTSTRSFRHQDVGGRLIVLLAVAGILTSSYSIMAH